MDRDRALELLGISEAGSLDAGTLRRAFRSRLREVHPDLNPQHDAAEMTVSITRAYRLLLDPRAELGEPTGQGPASSNRVPPSPDPQRRSGTRGKDKLAVEVLDDSSILVAADRETTFSRPPRHRGFPG